ncbi:hypothetical protein Cantr_05144 [Candida viswanathii]|uniref:Uncharacterized protein n=1 Tax=Candida viswanathii TaxID=5486 RepID=A0A367XQW7_9ASCO|nr:hypothetical protein Cantr_05144 [Candida viswanathii]
MSGNKSIQNKLTRPSTSLQRVLDKVVASVFTTAATATTQLHQQPQQHDDTNNSSTYVSSQKLYNKLRNILKIDDRCREQEAEFNNYLNMWGQYIPNAESSLYIKQFSALLNIQSSIKTQLHDKNEAIKLSLSFVNEREKKRTKLLQQKAKLEKQLKDATVRYGPNASNSILLNEKLEQIDCTLQVTEQQYIRTISNDLKDSLMEYAISLIATSKRSYDAANEFVQNLNSIEQDLISGNNASGENELARISPNKYSKLSRRKYPTVNLEPGFSIGDPLLKLRNYNLPTPQSLCSECKKGSPCIHTEGSSKQNLQQPQAPGQQQQQQSQQQNPPGSQPQAQVHPQLQHLHQQHHHHMPMLPQVHPIPELSTHHYMQQDHSQQRQASTTLDDDPRGDLPYYQTRVPADNNSIPFSDHWS